MPGFLLIGVIVAMILVLVIGMAVVFGINESD